MKNKLPCFFVVLWLSFVGNIVKGQDPGCIEDFRPINTEIETGTCTGTTFSECFTLSFDLEGCSGDSGEYFIWVDGVLIESGAGWTGEHIELEIGLDNCPTCRNNERLIECGADNGAGMRKEGGIVVIQG